MKIVQLSKKMALANINRLIEIDKIIPEDPWTADNFLMDFNRKWEYSFIALEDSQIVGFLISSANANNLHIHRLAISPEHHRKRIGTALMGHLILSCYALGIGYVTTKVEINNKTAQRFYEQNGFKKITSEGPRYIYKKMIQ